MTTEQSSAPTIELQRASAEAATVLVVRGDLDAFTSPLLEAGINECVAAAPTALIVDLSELDFLGSAGMAVLIRGNQSAGQATRFGVVADSASTSRPMKLIGLDKEVPLYPTLAAALEGIKQR